MKRILSIFMILSVLTVSFLLPLPVSASDIPFSGVAIRVDHESSPDYGADDLMDDLADAGRAIDGESQEDEGYKRFSDYLGGGDRDLETNDTQPDAQRNGKEQAQGFFEKKERADEMLPKYTGKEAPHVTDSKDPASEIPNRYFDADDEDDGSGKEENPPDYGFDFDDLSGPSQSFTGKDGTVTTVYDTGSVITTRPDGTRDGFDYAGRKFTQDADGNKTVTFSDGNTANVYADGRREFHFTDGNVIEYHDDDTTTLVNATGYRIDYDANDETNGMVYFRDGESARMFDEKGNPVIGSFTITGPNGEKLTYSNTIDYENDHEYTDENGDLHYQFGGSYSLVSEGNGKTESVKMEMDISDKGCDVSIRSEKSDGSSSSTEMHSATDEDGNYKGECTYTATAADGSTFEMRMSDTEDSAGSETSETTMKVRDADGSFSDAEFKSTTGADGTGETLTGTMTSRGADGSELDLKLRGDDNGCSFEVRSRVADGSELNLGMDGKRNADGSSDISLTSSYYNAETGEKGTSNISGHEDSSGEVTDVKAAFEIIGKDGTVDAMKITADAGGGTIECSDGSTGTIQKDEKGEIASVDIDSPDGSFFKYDRDDGTEYSDAKTGDYYRAGADKTVEAAHFTSKTDGCTYDFHDGTGLFTSPDGGRVLWTHDDNGELIVTSPDGSYTVDEDGNLYRNGEPVRKDGKWVNTDTGFKPEESSQDPDEDSSEEPEESEESSEEPSEESSEAPETVRYPTLEEICGTYQNGSITITDLVIPDELREAQDSDDPDRVGCDINPEEWIGQTRTAGFKFTQTGPDRATFDFLNDEDADAGAAMSDDTTLNEFVYDPETGVLRMIPVTTEEGTVTIEFQCEYAQDASAGVAIKGKLREDFSGEYKGIMFSCDISGDQSPAPVSDSSAQDGE